MACLANAIRGLDPHAPLSDAWRTGAAALLRLDAKERHALAALFEEEGVTDEARMHVIDLLVAAGSLDAQVILRRLLSLAVARRSSRPFAAFIRRVGALQRPDGPSLRFLMSVYAESRGEPSEIRASCAYALGSAAGRAHASGDTDAAVRASDVIRRDLLQARVALDRCALLAALGNVGAPSDVVVVARFTRDPDLRVRAASAIALRKLDVAEARAHLFALLGDREDRVAESALAALSEQRLDVDEVARLAEHVLQGRTSPTLDPRMLIFLSAMRTRRGACTAILEAAVRELLLRVGRAPSAVGPASIAYPSSSSYPSMPVPGSVPPVRSDVVARGSGARRVELPPQSRVPHDVAMSELPAEGGAYRLVSRARPR